MSFYLWYWCHVIYLASGSAGLFAQPFLVKVHSNCSILCARMVMNFDLSSLHTYSPQSMIVAGCVGFPDFVPPACNTKFLSRAVVPSLRSQTCIFSFYRVSEVLLANKGHSKKRWGTTLRKRPLLESDHSYRATTPTPTGYPPGVRSWHTVLSRDWMLFGSCAVFKRQSLILTSNFLRTSSPLTTCPNTTCFPSNLLRRKNIITGKVYLYLFSLSVF